MQILDIKQESYFPQNFKIFGVILIFGALTSFGLASPVTLLRIIITISLFLLGMMMIFTRYGLKIDPQNKTYMVYTLLLGFKFGNSEAFNFIDKIYINQVTEQALATTRTGAKFDLKNNVFKAFVRIDSGKKIHLDTDKNEEALKERLDRYKTIIGSVYRPVNE